MTGLRTHEGYAVISPAFGLSIDTYASRQALLMAELFRFYRECGDDLVAVRELIDRAIAQMQSDLEGRA